ncbi:MAG: aminotransferase class V-fold PLP-dependent enzyme, partial [Candidatus Binatia bacterium]
GTPNRLGSVGLAASLAYRNALPEPETERRILALGGELIGVLRSLGAHVWTPDRDEERAGIVTFTLRRSPREDLALRQFLESRRIYVSARYCSGVGGVRAAIHVYNTRDDLEALLDAIGAFRRR